MIEMKSDRNHVNDEQSKQNFVKEPQENRAKFIVNKYKQNRLHQILNKKKKTVKFD